MGPVKFEVLINYTHGEIEQVFGHINDPGVQERGQGEEMKPEVIRALIWDLKPRDWMRPARGRAWQGKRRDLRTDPCFLSNMKAVKKNPRSLTGATREVGGKRGEAKTWLSGEAGVPKRSVSRRW